MEEVTPTTEEIRTVYKYPLELVREQVLSLPALGPVAVHVDAPDGRPTIWVEVAPSAATAAFRVWTIGTGRQLPTEAPACFLGTVLVGPFVWHFYSPDFPHAYDRRGSSLGF